MIRKLRFKLILSAMISLFTVLAAIIGTVNVLNYQGIIRDADQILNILDDNNGRFPEQSKTPDKEPASNRNPQPQSPELPYESRFYSVLLDVHGTVLSTDTGKIAAVDSAKAGEYAKEIWQSGKEKGFIDTYRFLCSQKDTDSSETRIIFLDCSRSLNSFRSVLILSCSISGLGLLMVLFLMILLSKYIVRPFSENYEKQKRFITDAGHEIKTPITIINADADVLEMDTGSNEWIDDIRVQTERLSHLTKDLIDLARMEEGNSQTTMIEFPLSEVISEMAASFQSLALMQSKRLTVRIEPLLSFYGDEASIRKLLSILLDNALKYTNVTGLIQLEAVQKGRQIQLTFTNTTQEKLDREQLTHLFDRFYRLDTSRNSETGGYGIGLSIAQAVVQMHKGRLSVSAIDDHTIQFICLLPVRTARKMKK